MFQKELFSRFTEPLITPAHHARSDDPDTSHEAARELHKQGKLAAAMARAEVWLRRFPDSTALELEAESGLQDGKIRKRLNDLRRYGRAETAGKRRCRVSGRMAYVWRATARD